MEVASSPVSMKIGRALAPGLKAVPPSRLPTDPLPAVNEMLLPRTTLVALEDDEPRMLPGALSATLAELTWAAVPLGPCRTVGSPETSLMLMSPVVVMAVSDPPPPLVRLV